MTQRGFTLVELLLSTTIITLLVGVSVPIYASFANRNNLSNTAQTVANALRRAQTYARSGNGDSAWGLAFQSGSVVLFKGATYATRDANFDEAASITAPLLASGLSEVDFARLTATPNTNGSITLTDSTTNTTRTITINAKGMVDY